MSGAEIIGLAASVVQLADVGLRLSVNLYTYTRKVKSADRSIEALSNEIATTGAILRQLGAQFDDEHTRQLCKPQAIDTARGLVADCEKVFAKLQKLADPLEPAKKSKVGILQRVKFTFLESHIDELKANLDRLKSSLLVILNLLILAEQVRNKETPQILGEQKQLLQSLVAETFVNEQRHHAILKFIKQAEQSDASSETTLVAQPFESLIAKTDSLPQVVSPDSNFPEGLRRHCGRIIDHGRLVTNLLGQVSSQEYKLDHAHRLGLHNGILDIHWNAWSHMRKAHGHQVFLKLFGGFEDVARHWNDQVLLNTQLEPESVKPQDLTQDDGIRHDNPSKKNRLSHRSRTGCWTCRTRRVKCDEARPLCERCATIGQTCDYGLRLSFRDDNDNALKAVEAPSEALEVKETSNQASDGENRDSHASSTIYFADSREKQVIEQDEDLRGHSENKDNPYNPFDGMACPSSPSKNSQPTLTSKSGSWDITNSDTQLNLPKHDSNGSNLSHVLQHLERQKIARPNDENSTTSSHTDAPQSMSSPTSKEVKHASMKKAPLPMEYHRIGFARKYDKKRGRMIKDTENVKSPEDTLYMNEEQYRPGDRLLSDPQSEISTQQQDASPGELHHHETLIPPDKSIEAPDHNEEDKLYSIITNDEREGKGLSIQRKIADDVPNTLRDELTPQRSSGTTPIRNSIARSGSDTILAPCLPRPKQSPRSVRRVGNFHAGSDPSKPHSQGDGPMQEAGVEPVLTAEVRARNQDIERELQRDGDDVEGSRAELNTSTGTTPSRYTISGPDSIDSLGELPRKIQKATKKEYETNQYSTWMSASAGAKRKSHKSGFRQRVMEKPSNSEVDRPDDSTAEPTDQFQNDFEAFMGSSQVLGSSSYVINPMNAGSEIRHGRRNEVPTLSFSNYSRGDTPPPWHKSTNRDPEDSQSPTESASLKQEAIVRQNVKRPNRRTSSSNVSSGATPDKATIRTPKMVMAEREARQARRVRATEGFEIIQPSEPVRARQRDSDVLTSKRYVKMKTLAEQNSRAAEDATQRYSLAEVRIPILHPGMNGMALDHMRYEGAPEATQGSAQLEQKQKGDSRRSQLENTVVSPADVVLWSGNIDATPISPEPVLQPSHRGDERSPSSSQDHAASENTGHHEVGSGKRAWLITKKKKQSDLYRIRSYPGIYSRDTSAALSLAQNAALTQESFSRTPASCLSLDSDLEDITTHIVGNAAPRTPRDDPEVDQFPNYLDTREPESSVPAPKATWDAPDSWSNFGAIELESSNPEPVHELMELEFPTGGATKTQLENDSKDNNKTPNLSDDNDEIKGLQEEAKKDDKLDQWLIADRRSSYGGSDDNKPDHLEGDWSHNIDHDDTFLSAEMTSIDDIMWGECLSEPGSTDHIEFDMERLQDEAQKDQKLEAQLQSLGAFGEDIGKLLLEFSTLSPAEVGEIA